MNGIKRGRDMSHSKMTKRGYSLYLEKWNPSAKRFVNTCVLCRKTGYSPHIEEPDFCIAPVRKVKDLERYAIYSELIKVLPKLPLDSLGRCKDCARIQDGN